MSIRLEPSQSGAIPTAGMETSHQDFDEDEDHALIDFVVENGHKFGPEPVTAVVRMADAFRSRYPEMERRYSSKEVENRLLHITDHVAEYSLSPPKRTILAKYLDCSQCSSEALDTEDADCVVTSASTRRPGPRDQISRQHRKMEGVPHWDDRMGGYQLTVTALASRVITHELRSLFERYGRVADASLFSTFSGRGYGFVAMKDLEEAQEASWSNFLEIETWQRHCRDPRPGYTPRSVISCGQQVTHSQGFSGPSDLPAGSTDARTRGPLPDFGSAGDQVSLGCCQLDVDAARVKALMKKAKLTAEEAFALYIRNRSLYAKLGLDSDNNQS